MSPMRSVGRAALVATAVAIGATATGGAAADAAVRPRVVVCYQEAPGTGCRGPVHVSSGQRLDMILAPGTGTPYWSAREECDQSGGRLDHYVVRTRHGRIWRWICRGVDF